MRAGRVLRQIIMDRVIEQVPDLMGRVYDKATESVAYPYATMGPSYGTDAGAECIDAREITVQVDVWHSASSKGVCEDLVDDVAAALNGWADDDRLTMHPMLVSLVRVTDDPDGVSVHGIVQVEAMVEGD